MTYNVTMYTFIWQWVTVSAGSAAAASNVEAAITSVEYLNVNQQWSQDPDYGWIFIETDAPHGASVEWGLDKEQSKMPGSFEPSVNCTFENPFTVKLTQTFESYKVQTQHFYFILI